uniref:G_PROTEIN_RECEP_F1_2 domain-containing protein n=1 Tax=Panagrellus redivivus TaxID=6233 RepID=A0A7E5A230_PANRE
MSDYKWYLVHQLTWSYLFDLYMGLWKPVPLWPFYLGYSAGIFANVVGNYTTIQLLIACFFAIGMGFSVFISIMHRAMQASPLSNFYKHYSCVWARVSVYILVFAILITVLIVPLCIFSFSLQTELKDSLTSKYPELVRIFELHPSIFGYDTTFAQYSVGYGCLMIIVLICVILIAVAAYFNLVRILKRNKAHLSAGTYKLQVYFFPESTFCKPYYGRKQSYLNHAFDAN